ncbi:MAG: cysQ [Deltaproteobacteria bacterium]|nr:cysQ [Deltaproteobacteria bacterium]
MEPGFFQECLFAALRAARAAGDAILTVYHGEFDVEYKEDHSPLTVADRRAHTVIKEHLAADERLGGIPLLSEEGRSIPYEVRSRWDHFWLVDPLDGTKEFVKRLDEFTVNIALIQAGKPILGVVLVPAQGLLYYGLQGLGSYKVKRPDAVPDLVEGLAKASGRDALVRALLDGSDRLPQAERRFGEVALISAGSALKFALVAEGIADIYPRFGPTMEWDTAAGQCLVEQSGGTVVELGAQIPLVYNKRELLNPHFICRAAHCLHLPYPLE